MDLPFAYINVSFILSSVCAYSSRRKESLISRNCAYSSRKKTQDYRSPIKMGTIGESHVKTFGDYNILSSVVGWVIFTLNVVILD